MTHPTRHHNPAGHVLAALGAALGAAALAVGGHHVWAVVAVLLAAVNVFHAVVEHRHPVPRPTGVEHLAHLREQIRRELGPDDGEPDR
jgi:hypothetical protein